MASTRKSSKQSTANRSKTSAASSPVAPSTVKRCTICPVPHNSSTAHERRLGLIRRPGTPSVFHRLAPELRALIYCHLTAADVLRLRFTCRSLLNLIQLDIGEIIHSLATNDQIIRLAHSLAKSAIDTSTPNVGYLAGLIRQCHVAEALGRFLAEVHVKEIYAYNSLAQLARSPYAHKVNFVAENLKPYLMIISHMVGAYRSSVTKIVQEERSVGEMRLQACRSEREIMRKHASNDRVSLVFEFLRKILSQQLRPASYATFLERRISGWTKPSASDDKFMSLIVFGGLSAINHILNNPTYNKGIQACEDWQTQAGNSKLTRPATIQRIRAILPNGSHFFNPWAKAESRGEFCLKPDTREFQLWLRTNHEGTDLGLRI
ncbi:MAG: hypothetical protein LQ337_006908 [Flavoplaca oasis]|nr:MAG: hypothetical protein LQ337_006908 [Flavoplaca oasis]